MNFTDCFYIKVSSRAAEGLDEDKERHCIKSDGEELNFLDSGENASRLCEQQENTKPLAPASISSQRTAPKRPAQLPTLHKPCLINATTSSTAEYLNKDSRRQHGSEEHDSIRSGEDEELHLFGNQGHSEPLKELHNYIPGLAEQQENISPLALVSSGRSPPKRPAQPPTFHQPSLARSSPAPTALQDPRFSDAPSCSPCHCGRTSSASGEKFDPGVKVVIAELDAVFQRRMKEKNEEWFAEVREGPCGHRIKPDMSIRFLVSIILNLDLVT